MNLLGIVCGPSTRRGWERRDICCSKEAGTPRSACPAAAAGRVCKTHPTARWSAKSPISTRASNSTWNALHLSAPAHGCCPWMKPPGLPEPSLLAFHNFHILVAFFSTHGIFNWVKNEKRKMKKWKRQRKRKRKRQKSEAQSCFQRMEINRLFKCADPAVMLASLRKSTISCLVPWLARDIQHSKSALICWLYTFWVEISPISGREALNQSWSTNSGSECRWEIFDR